MSDEMIPEGSVPEGTPSESPAEQGGTPWIKMIPKEIADQNAEVFQKYQTFDSYVSDSINAMKEAERLRKYDGATIIPDENADEQTWQSVWSKLGRPEAKDGYGLEEEALAEIFYNANLTKAQAEKITKGLIGYSETTQKEFEGKRKETYQQAINSLREKYGNEVDKKLTSAQLAMTNLGGQKLVKTLQDKGLDNDPAMIEFFVNVGTLMQEGNIPTGHRLAPKPKGFVGSYTTMKGID